MFKKNKNIPDHDSSHDPVCNRIDHTLYIVMTTPTKVTAEKGIWHHHITSHHKKDDEQVTV